ncbi:MAG TPA: M56 family metallopeptidase [Kofleriaceae bacterium]|nr:M56 family metallopeptidase [Kofleriaceae bacterium]
MMAHLDAATSVALDALVASTIHGTILAAITAVLVTTVLRRARPAVKSALWTLVLLKFVIPVGPALPVSLTGFIEGAFAADAAAETVAPTAHAVLGAHAGLPAHASPPTLLVLAKLVLIAVLLVGIAAIAIRRVRAHRRLRARFAALPGDPALDTALADAAGRVGLRRVPSAVLSDEVSGPFLIGFRRPLMVVPRWLLAERGLDAALVHELAHVRRGDTWSRGFQLVVRTLFFFWPVVRWVSARLDVEREMACDQWVLARSRTDHRDYVRVLVGLARRSRGGELCGASATLLPRRHHLEQRVEMLLRAQPARHRVGTTAGLAVAGWAVVSLAGSARAASPLAAVGGHCAIDETLLTQIIATYPEADSNGDGVLSRDEICAHQERMKRQLVDRAFEELPPDQRDDLVSQIDPLADLDGNGVLDSMELERVKIRVVTTLNPQRLGLDPVAFPGQVCEEAPTMCTEQPAAPAVSYLAE